MDSDRRLLKLKILDQIKTDIVETYRLTVIEEFYLFHYPEGTTATRLRTILEERLKFYQTYKQQQQ
jgi:hypothetical protein